MPRLKNRRHERFAREYVTNGFVGAKAARAAGSTAVNASQAARELLSRPDVAARVTEINDNILEETMMTKQEVLNEMAKLAGFNPANTVDDNGVPLPLHELPEDAAASVVEIDEKGRPVKFSNQKRAALSDLMKHYDAFADHQKSGAGEIHVHLMPEDADL